MSRLSSKLTRTHNRLQNELPFFANRCLVIKDKAGQIVPFQLNQAQRYLHTKLEEQLRKQGWVRALILKGRQQGCSTYVGARFYHKTSLKQGKSTFILSHEAKTTAKLFDMVERFYDNVNPAIRPHQGKHDAQQLKFDLINSEYTIGTAGNENVGRGGTLQFFHGSEVGFWEKTDGIETGILQSVADLPGTEIILESTANGMGNMFHQKCMQALEGKGDYMLVFIPWFWQDEYRRETPEDFAPTPEESKLAELYGWDKEQIYWRRKKIETLGSLWKFQQEYPNNVKEAFVSSGNSLVSPEKLVEAMKSTIIDRSAPLIIGVDPARKGDRSIVTFRRGREFIKYVKYEEMDQMRLAGILAKIINRENPAKVFVDVAHGYGTLDRLRELGFGDIVRGVPFSEGALDPEKFANKRAEILCAVRDWVEEGGVSVPDDIELQVDLLSVPDYKETSTNRIIIEPKEKIKKDLGKSPDIYDAFALTFAYPVRHTRDNRNGQQLYRKPSVSKSQGPLKTLNRTRKRR